MQFVQSSVTLEVKSKCPDFVLKETRGSAFNLAKAARSRKLSIEDISRLRKSKYKFHTLFRQLLNEPLAPGQITPNSQEVLCGCSIPGSVQG